MRPRCSLTGAFTTKYCHQACYPCFLLAKRTSRPNDIVSFERFECQRCGKVDEGTSRLNYKIGLSQICTIRTMLAAIDSWSLWRYYGRYLLLSGQLTGIATRRAIICNNVLLTLNHGVAIHGTNWSGITMRISFDLWRILSMEAKLKTLYLFKVALVHMEANFNLPSCQHWMHIK